MAPSDQPGVAGTAARLPNWPGTQNETPLSSALEICGESVRVATAIAPTRVSREVPMNDGWIFIGISTPQNGFASSLGGCEHTFLLEIADDGKPCRKQGVSHIWGSKSVANRPQLEICCERCTTRSRSSKWRSLLCRTVAGNSPSTYSARPRMARLLCPKAVNKYGGERPSRRDEGWSRSSTDGATAKSSGLEVVESGRTKSGGGGPKKSGPDRSPSAEPVHYCYNRS